MEIKKIKILIEPDETQKGLIEKEIKYSRYVYNFFIKTRYDIWKKKKKNISFDDEKEMLKKLKIKKGWLKNVENSALEQAIRDLDSDYYKFFKLNGPYPQYRKVDDKEQWYKTKNVNNCIKLHSRQNMITLPTLDVLKFTTNEKIRGKITYVKIQKTDDKYEATLTIQRS